MRFQWDEEKRKAVLAKHHVDILNAALIFEGPTLKRADNRRDYGEERWISMGMVDDECFIVVHTDRDGEVRLITAWKGGEDERRQYQEGIARRTSGDEGGG